MRKRASRPGPPAGGGWPPGGRGIELLPSGGNGVPGWYTRPQGLATLPGSSRGRGGLRPPLELQLVQAMVSAAQCEQLLVGAGLHDAALVEHVDAVDVLDRREPIGNDVRCVASA